VSPLPCHFTEVQGIGARELPRGVPKALLWLDAARLRSSWRWSGRGAPSCRHGRHMEACGAGQDGVELAPPNTAQGPISIRPIPRARIMDNVDLTR
jgi:hypothetical protein